MFESNFHRVLNPLSNRSMFDHFVGLALKGLKQHTKQSIPVYTDVFTEK